jgi:hypothetical protein
MVRQVAALMETYVEGVGHSRGRTARNRVQRHLADLKDALDNISYISLAQLVAAIKENCKLIRQCGADVCLALPQERDKSNMWVTLIAAQALKPKYVACDCALDIQALKEIGCPILLFDDCMYSGSQMKMKIKLWKKHTRGTCEVFCVPAFWHIPDDDCFPAVEDAINERSARLAGASEFLDKNFWAVTDWQQLTYLQTKMPDNVSFPPFMHRLDANPLSGKTKASSALQQLFQQHAASRHAKQASQSFALARNCGALFARGIDACPEAIYKTTVPAYLAKAAKGAELTSGLRDAYGDGCAQSGPTRTVK